MHVSNVVPFNDGVVGVWGHIQWDTDLRVRISLLW